jgi:hypothetical protein
MVFFALNCYDYVFAIDCGDLVSEGGVYCGHW